MVNKILIIPKYTKIEWDMKRLKISQAELINFYKKEGLNSERIFNSHNNQKKHLENLKNLLPKADIIGRDDITVEKVKSYDFVIAFGGDNHFQYVTHFLNGTPILGINSDPERSEGALTTLNADEMEANINKLFEGNFKIEEWTRLAISVDGKDLPQQALNEVYIGEEKRHNMSRHIITLGDKSEEQKGSGIIISTGAGSTGWYNSASRYLFPEGNSFSNTAREARFILTEPHNGRLSSLKLIHGSIKGSEELNIISLSDSSARLSIDCLDLINLREGAKIKITIGEPLKVINLK